MTAHATRFRLLSALVMLVALPGLASALPAGFDYFGSIGEHQIEFFGEYGFPYGVYDFSITGPTEVYRAEAVYDPDPDHFLIDTEIVSMTLHGIHPDFGRYSLIQSPTRSSTGEIRGQTDGTEDPAGSPNPDFPAESFFDVFFELTLEDVGTEDIILYNRDPLHMETLINGIPPYGDIYQYPGGGVDLYFRGPEVVVGRTTAARHIPTPEPGTLMLLASGLSLAAGVAWRRRRR
jgi:hypothetical protein